VFELRRDFQSHWARGCYLINTGLQAGECEYNKKVSVSTVSSEETVETGRANVRLIHRPEGRC